MVMHYHYSHPTTPAGAGFDIDLGPVVQVAQFSAGSNASPSDAFTGCVTAAAVGDVAQFALIMDDPAGTLGYNNDAIVGLHRVYIVEDSIPTSSDQVVWNGYVMAREYARGATEGVSPLGPGRRVTVELQDDNAILAFRQILRSDPYGKRPPETADARLKWLLSSPYLNTVHDDGLVDHAGLAAIKMDAADYRGQYARDVLNDIVLNAGLGWNYWAQYNADGSGNGHVQLWFGDSNSSTAFTSTVTISNVASDIAAGAWAPHEDAKLRRDPSKVFAGVDVPYANGAVYQSSALTSYNFAYRDGTFPNPNVKTAAQAKTAATRFLDQSATENDLGTLTVTVPASSLNLVKAGMRVFVRMTHWPGYEAGQYMRVTRRTIARALPTDLLYDMTLEVSGLAPPGFHQVVLSGSINESQQVTLSSSGTLTIQWGGAPPGTPPTPMPAVVQDTDGYSGYFGILVGTYYTGGGPLISSLTIPPGLGGTYHVGMEGISTTNSWWPVGGIPTATPYIYSGNPVSSGTGVIPGGTSTVTYAICANGVPVASTTVTYSPTGLAYWNPVTAFDAVVRLNAGDVITATVTYAGPGWALGGPRNAYGAEVTSVLAGALFLTYRGP